MVKFADDTKVGRPITNDQDVEKLRGDLNKLFEWSVEWQMMFNTDKCTVMHLGFNNKEAEYKLGTAVLKKSNQERDLGVIIGRNGKAAEQCIMAVKKRTRFWE
jgi:hypothetical protein